MARRTVIVADPDPASAADLSELVEQLGLRAVRTTSPREVLNVIEKGPTALFVDLKSPTMRGGHLLAELRRRQVPLPVVVVTNNGSKNDVVFALRYGCVDWIDKPADKSAVVNALKRVARETRRMAQVSVSATPQMHTRALIRDLVERIRQGNIALPEVPQVVVELRRVLSDITADSEQVLKVLEKDPSIAARIISTANTITYGGRGRITDLKSAITRLGNRTIASIAQTAAFRGMFAFRTPAFKQVFRSMWQGHLVSANLCRELLAEIGAPNEEDETYLLGLLHNCGEPFLLRVFAEIFMRQNNQVLSMEEVLEVIRDYHGLFGSSLMAKWNMGELFTTVAGRHHDPAAYEDGAVDPNTLKLMHACNLCDRVVEHVGPSFYPSPPAGPQGPDSFEALQLPEERWDTLVARAQEMKEEMSSLV